MPDESGWTWDDTRSAFIQFFFCGKFKEEDHGGYKSDRTGAMQ